MKGTGNIVHGHWSNDKANEGGTHSSSCPAEVHVCAFALFATLDIRKETRKSKNGYHGVEPLNGGVNLYAS